MLAIRFLVVDKDNVVMGGNQRLKACEVAGLTEVPVVRASDLSWEEVKTFVIADNSYFGEFDDQMVRSQYTQEEIDQVGMKLIDIPAPKLEVVQEGSCEQTSIEEKKQIYDANDIKQVMTYFPLDIYDNLMESFESIKKHMGCEENPDMLLRLINYWKENCVLGGEL